MAPPSGPISVLSQPVEALGRDLNMRHQEILPSAITKDLLPKIYLCPA